MRSWEGRQRGAGRERQRAGGEKAEGRRKGHSWATVQRPKEREDRETGREWGTQRQKERDPDRRKRRGFREMDRDKDRKRWRE